MLFSHNAEKGFIPASNQKLFVSACALESWGEPFERVLAKRIKRRRLRKKSFLFTEINGESNNRLAEIIFRTIGDYQKTSPQSAIRTYLKSKGINPRGLRLVDGSGRSRKNRATPLLLVNLLNAIYSSKLKNDFLSSLAVSGKRGTLKRRLLSLTGMVYGKTGYLYSVNCLSGYLFSPRGRFSFSIMINDRKSNFSNWEFMEGLLSVLGQEGDTQP
uniref:D-alanyl-D-alanine carboxypeptidase/D-alanyl-D-alanine-endopeptidase n=1 Tax=candidate division WOR-3 bacterium TaxID=2052148 RepID=A0A7C3Z027_UNCW3